MYSQYIKKSITALLIGLIIGYLVARFVIWSGNVLEMPHPEIYKQYLIIFGVGGFAFHAGYTTLKDWPTLELGCFLSILFKPFFIVFYIALSLLVGVVVAIPKFIYHITKIKYG